MIAARTATIHGNGLAAVGEAFGAEVVAEVTSFSRNLHVFLLSFGLDPDRALVAEHNRPSGQFVQRASPIRQPNAKASYTYPGIWHNEFFNTKHALQCRAESIAVSSNVKDFEFGGNWVRPGGSSMHAGEKHLTARERPLVRFGLGLANWSERWFPDPLIFALAGIVIVFVVGLLLHQSPAKLAIQGGKSFWALVPFTMQMVMIIIGGYVVASTPIVYRVIRALAGIPKTPRGAVAVIALFSMLTSLISWGLSLIFSGLLVCELARRVKGLDYRAAGGAAYLGLGAVWAMGLSSSAAMLMATKSAMPPSLFNISGLIPLTQTLFLWQSMATAAILIVLSVLTAYLSAPSPDNARTAESYGIQYEPIRSVLEDRTKPGEWLEYSPLLTILVALLLGWYLVDVFRTSPQGALAALDLNTYNLIFITAGLLLHWRPKRFMRAVAECIPATGGVLIQFPLYAVIFGMIVGTGITDALAKLFASISTHNTYPLLVATYSAVLGIFIPSGGSKWVIEAPYVLQAANLHQVHLGWVVQIYNASEALPNLINPFWMLPLLGILKLKARDIVGYGVLQLMVHVPVVFFLCWLFAKYIPYVPPMR
jgi:short-chain fatty acids transporter